MSNVGYATLTVIPSAKGFASALNGQIDSPLAGAGRSGGVKAGGSFVGAFKGLVGPAMALAGGAMFSGFVAEAAKASDATDKFKATMSFAGLNTGAIDAATKAAKGYADQTVYDLPTIQNMIAQLASNGVKDYTGLTKAAGNLNAVAGGNADTFKSVAMTMTQTAGAGKLTTENWNQLSDAIPGAAGPLMKAMEEAGAYTGNFRDAMAEGEITSEEFNAALMKLGTKPVAVEAAKSTKTFEGAIGNLQATINSGLMTALDKMKPAITGVINGMASGVGAIVGFVGKAGPGFDRIGQGAQGLFDLLVKGDFSGNFAKAFKVEEDSALVDFLFTIRETVMSVGSTIGAAVGPILPQILSLVTSFSPLGILFKALQPVLPALAGAFGQLGAAVSGILGAALTFAAPLIQQIVSILSGVFMAAMPGVVAIITVLGNTFSTLTPVIMGVMGAVMPLVSSLLSSLAPILTNLVTAILPPVVSIFGNVVTAIGPLITIIASLLVPVIKALLPVVVTVFSVVSSVIQSAMKIIQGVIQVVTGIIKGDWSQVWTGIQNIASGVWSGIKALVSGAIKIVSSTISAVMNVIRSTWSTVWNGIVSFLGGAWSRISSGVSGGIEKVRSFFSGLIGKITGAIGNAGSALLQTGKDIIQGLIDGISSMMGSIGRAVINIVPEAIRGPFEKLLGIHSPSRVFRSYGVNIGEGLVLGIEDKYGDVEKAVQGLAPSAPAFRTPEVVAGGVTGSLASAFASQPRAEAAVVQHIHPRENMSEETVAEIAARKLERAGIR